MEENKELNNEPVIGSFKPKRKFISFVSAKGGHIRLFRNTAYLDASVLSGMLDGIKLKVTICDEDTIDIEEVDSNEINNEMMHRLLDEIDSREVTGYAQKFIVYGLNFESEDGDKCYLEVEHEKPVERISNILDSLKEEENKMEQVSVTISDKGLSFLDLLLSDDNGVDETSKDELLENDTDEVKSDLEPQTLSYLEESFRKMNEEKVNELKKRIEYSQKEIIKYKNEMNFAEKKLKEEKENLGVLKNRFESMTPGEEPNGYVFFVSEEQKNDLELDETTKGVASKIADIMNLKKDVLFNILNEGYYNIRIAKKDDFDTELDLNDFISTLTSIDVMGKITRAEKGLEYRGELNWHQIVQKMIRAGFEQDPEFDKFCNSNSYESKWSDKDANPDNLED